MIRFPSTTVILEGPDLSGKTSLYNKIHKLTKFRWNIQDRSSLSMMVYADLYGRDQFRHRENHQKEMYDLNNRMIFLLPSFSEIEKRFNLRGDELQDLTSLRRVYELFYGRFTRLMYQPNVCCLIDGEVDENAKKVVSYLDKLEMLSLSDISRFIQRFADSCPRNEATPITFTFYDDGTFSEIDESVLETQGEKEYYREIITRFLEKIRDERSGKNEYNLIQNLSSRRFVYADDSCISFIQGVYRDNILDMHFVLRSTDVKNKLKTDLKFLYYLTKCVYDEFQLSQENDVVRMRFNLNSAHILD